MGDLLIDRLSPPEVECGECGILFSPSDDVD